MLRIPEFKLDTKLNTAPGGTLIPLLEKDRNQAPAHTPCSSREEGHKLLLLRGVFNLPLAPSTSNEGRGMPFVFISTSKLT